MRNVLIAGAGKIGSLIACLLSTTKDYTVHIADIHFDGQDIKRLLNKVPTINTVAMDVSSYEDMGRYIQKNNISVIISCLPHQVNNNVVFVAKEYHLHYFDLTEDTAVVAEIKALAAGAKSAFVTQCGLAPGFVNIVANHLMQQFDKLDSAKLRVGALPQNTSNALHYALTWSTDGLINEYANPCFAVEQGESVLLQPLEGLEAIQLDGLLYEAFNTSGGLGRLSEIYAGKINTLNYKTMRYPGHCEKIRVLMKDLKLADDKAMLKKLLERAIPKTYKDIVIIYVSVTGYKQGTFLEDNFLKRIEPKEVQGINWSAIQLTTACGVCAVVDMVLANEASFEGFVLQETFSLETFLNNRFGQFYA